MHLVKTTLQVKKKTCMSKQIIIFKFKSNNKGQYVESHGVTHNCDYNISSGQVRSTFFTALENNDWWDNGAEPIWITAVNQVFSTSSLLLKVVCYRSLLCPSSSN